MYGSKITFRFFVVWIGAMISYFGVKASGKERLKSRQARRH